MGFEMLTDLEISRLKDRKLDGKTKRYNEYAIKKKLESWLADAKDVQVILDHMGYKKLGKIINPETFFALARITETALSVSGIPTFKARDQIVVGGGLGETIKLGKNERTEPMGPKDLYFVVRRATAEEKNQVGLLKTHIINLLIRLGKEDFIDVFKEAKKFYDDD